MSLIFAFAFSATAWGGAVQAQLAKGVYGFVVYHRSVDISSGWFELLDTDEIDVRFDYPRGADVRGGYIEHAGRVCFSGFDDRVFPNGCGSLGVRWIILDDDYSIWFASAAPGAFMLKSPFEGSEARGGTGVVEATFHRMLMSRRRQHFLVSGWGIPGVAYESSVPLLHVRSGLFGGDVFGDLDGVADYRHAVALRFKAFP